MPADKYVSLPTSTLFDSAWGVPSGGIAGAYNPAAGQNSYGGYGGNYRSDAPGHTLGATGSVDLGGIGFYGDVWDTIRNTLQREDTEGQYEQAAIQDAYVTSVLGQLYDRDDLTQEDKTDYLASFLNTTGYSADVVTQTMGIPKTDVLDALAQNGYDVSGNPIDPTAPYVPPTDVTVPENPANAVGQDQVNGLVDIIKAAGGTVVEGAADLGNLVFQAVTLGQGPKLEAVIPNIMDILNGGLGGTLVLGGGNNPVTVLGTGQTGVGAGTNVGIGGIIGKVVGMVKEGGSLVDILKSIPSNVYGNLPEIITAAQAAGLTVDAADKETLVGFGLDGSLFDEDDKSTTDDSTPVGDDDNKADSGGSGGSNDTPTVGDNDNKADDSPSDGGSSDGGGGSGGVDTPTEQQGVRVTTVEEAPTVDLDYLFDVGGDSIFAPNVEDPDEEDAPRVYAKYASGGMIDTKQINKQILDMLERK